MIGLAIKITGSLLIAAGGILTGLKIRKEYKQRRTLLKAFQDALHYADDAIAIENALLDDVLMNCGAKFFPEEKGSDLFSCAAGCLRNEFGSFENAWTKACADFFPKTPCLREKEIECISGIGKALGLANTQRQSAHIASVVKKLAELEREAQQEDEKEGKNAIKIAIAVSAAIIVILF
jgi:hypothetical protein